MIGAWLKRRDRRVLIDTAIFMAIGAEEPRTPCETHEEYRNRIVCRIIGMYWMKRDVRDEACRKVESMNAEETARAFVGHAR